MYMYTYISIRIYVDIYICYYALVSGLLSEGSRTMLLLKTHHDNMGSHMVAFTSVTAWIDSPFLAQVTYTCVSISAGEQAACSATPLPGTEWRFTRRELKSTSDWPKRSLRSPTHETHPRHWPLAANANGFTTRRAAKPGGKRNHASRTFGCPGELSSTSSA